MRPRDFWDWLLALPADFDVPEADRIDRTISNHDEVILLSKAAWQFCDDHGCDGRRKHAISLAVEEMATNTVLTGFRPGHHNTIDMRIAIGSARDVQYTTILRLNNLVIRV